MAVEEPRQSYRHQTEKTNGVSGASAWQSVGQGRAAPERGGQACGEKPQGARTSQTRKAGPKKTARGSTTRSGDK